MLKFLRNSLEDIDDVIVDVATSMKLPEVITEKDLYVSYILDYLFARSEFKNYFEFKGGTSLSKGYGLINRFSEDIDVVLKSEVIGENLEEIIHLESKSQKEKMAEKLNTKAIEFYKNKLIPSIMNDLKKETNIPFKERLEEKELAIYLEYPTNHSDSYIPNAVKLEIGPLAAWTPCESITLSSFIAQKYPNLFDKPVFPVLITRPVRTFWEKAVIMHQEAHRVDGKVPRHYSRHYYDLYKMYSSFVKQEAFDSLDLLEEVRRFTMTFYNRGWAKFEDAVPGSFMLYPNEKSLSALKADYNDMNNMMYGEIPYFEEVLSTIKKLEDEINGLKK